MGFEDSVSVPDNSAGSGPKVKVFRAVDSNGNTVETQAVTLVDVNGNDVLPLTESTGLRILRMLEAIDKKLAKQTGTLPAKG